jgi:hypothetical protein
MQGSMTTERSIISRGVALAAFVGLSLGAPTAAQASPLLSGYGGPGEGNQVILGSTLIGGPGGGSTTGGPPSASSNGSESNAASPPAGGAGAAGHGSARTASGARRGRATATKSLQVSGGSLAGQLYDRSYHALERTAGSSGPFGLSAAEIAYIVAAVAALAFTGVLTRRLNVTKTAKGH